MKKLLSVAVIFAVLVNIAQAQQGQNLPRLAVVEFTTNVTTEMVRADSLTVRNLVESQMVASGPGL
jgi:predicted secreted protein